MSESEKQTEPKPDPYEGEGEAKSSKSGKKAFPKRYIVAIMVFLGICVQYALRVNLSVAIGAMCNPHTVEENGFTITKKAEFDWSSQLQGTILGAFYYGYMTMQIPGGWLGQRFGGTRVFGICLGIASILTMLTPIAARTSVVALIILRVIEGLTLGALFPCNHAIWSKWAPPQERTRLFTITVAGCPVGTILSMPLSGLMSKYGFDGGWASVFYCFGAVGLMWFFIWQMSIHASPAEHPTISVEEKEFIENAIADTSTKKIKVPWKSILTSGPVWAVIFANFTADWGMYTILICLPKYFIEVLHFDLAKTGFLAALPYVLKAIVGPSGGILVDWLIKNKMSVRNTRRCVFTVGCTVASIFVLLTGYANHPYLAVFLLTIGVGITGINAAGYAVNILDIAPKYAGVIMGVTNVFGAAPGFISPQIVGIITPNKTASEWRVVFWITFIVYIIGIVLFGLLVSGDKQPWATENDEESDKDTEKGEEKKKDEEDGKKEEEEGEKDKKEDEEKPTESADEKKDDEAEPPAEEKKDE
ncbi:vesicular glutamate transporter 1-like [Actinia tenebrosa]|uniref:Sialin n=1 Tax=Actinia tenebrosa TaxID=6105 RepID=A0A6P8HZF8_ACTTE|nr:vesicular glutamate transporter 1-like [Actinia tenebrosa]